jgi:tRNA/tmRNA/rRNA uracil-C5-methylase (TrmA/RlmC/RlmD family)
VCCGTGTIGISLARRVKAVIGVEVEASAVEDAKVNSSLNGLDNCTWVAGKAEEVMEQLLEVRARGREEHAKIRYDRYDRYDYPCTQL